MVVRRSVWWIRLRRAMTPPLSLTWECCYLLKNKSEGAFHESALASSPLAVVRPPRSKAVAAVDRLVAARLKWNLRYFAAAAARSLEHLAFATSAAVIAAASAGIAAAATAAAALTALSLAGGAAIGATAWLISKAFRCVEFLFACRKGKRCGAIHAVEGLVSVHRNSRRRCGVKT